MDAAVELSAAAAAMVHRCKVCGKGFSCGRSLGGHMRSHISLGEAVAVAEMDGGDEELKRVSVNGGRSSNGAVGYGLRENPKKTRRLSDFADDEEEEGGHGGEHRPCRECGKLFSSLRSLFEHMRCHASGGRDHDDGDDEFGGAEQAEAEEEEVVAPAEVTVMPAPPRRRRRSMRVAAPAPAPPLMLGGFEKEQEDVALGLLMLSRDTGLWSSPVKAEPFEKVEQKKARGKKRPLLSNGYDYNSDGDSALLQYGGDGEASKSRKRRASYYVPNSISPKQQQRAVPPAAKRTKYMCPGCGKVFNSYQALGGHRASHKRINTSCSAPKVSPAAAPEPSSETYASLSTLSPSASPDSAAAGIVNRKSNKSAAVAADEKFECPICFRVFASVQALGGHKRSHIMAGACSDDGELYTTSSGNAELELEQHSAATAGFPDLNFPPAPSEEA
ncbi:hypothetical protein ABZP36_000007 [Zizania latifolia]